ncbi:MAG: hypothetical protein FJ405_00215 [Verrucomicrobia bacterium]|nr:hypothetical protein [Verrucomicrobiota bacterium]
MTPGVFIARLELCLLIAGCVLSPSIAAEPPTAAPGVRRAVEPSRQKESDWQDRRWQQSELGSFLASTLTPPNGAIAKGLSVRVGARGEAAVGYDTAAPNLRVAWTSGFLEFPTHRYGINGAPQPAGPVSLVAPASGGWHGANAHYTGLSVHKDRVILKYRVNGTRLWESPWIHKVATNILFTRTFEAEGIARPILLDLVEGELATPVASDRIGEYSVAVMRAGQTAWMAAVRGGARIGTNVVSRNVLTLELPVSTKIQQSHCFLWSGPVDLLPAIREAALKAPTEDPLGDLAEPTGGRWPAIETKGELGTGTQAYVIDTLQVPHDNPWKALMFLSGIDFLPNGDAAVCTLHGDVWTVSGIDAKLEKLTWRRFATGLFQPLGLRVVKGVVHVLGRDQITALHDRNRDGEADDYVNFSNLIQTSTGGHDYVAALETDAAGNFYYVDPIGAHKIAADGKQRTVIATGWRNPNGMSVGPDGTITVTPQEGDWTPSSQISEVRYGGYHGFGGPQEGHPNPLGYDPPLCWIPHSVDNSTGSQVWSPREGWGPLSGQLLSLSFGRCSLALIFRDKVKGYPQGGIVPLKGKFLSGVMRGAFRAYDRQLYVVGSRGWQTAAVQDGCLQRMRYTGANHYDLLEMTAHRYGLRLVFGDRLEKSAAEDVGSWGLEQWNYKYAREYGSKEWSVKDPTKMGRDKLEVTSATLMDDERTVVLALPEIQPVMQMRVRYNLNAKDGIIFTGEAYSTIHALR